ncbi:MAG: tRNA preQ1(34) S-adenosylmethionine ribosyltransferase-isomerase QueA [Proteobacteria bacterium]|nr:tRNA preQ1(34) S-adenosylmethionine ribosyltransferase-isomerase QueA [Pseudomonadota bacterium]
MLDAKVDDFDFELPRELIALRPARPRDSARLLVIDGEFQDRAVKDLPSLLEPGDLLVVNDTRVLPSRLRGRRGDAKVEVTLLRPLGSGTWTALARPARKLRAADRIDFASGLSAEVAEKGEAGEVTLAFGGQDVLAALEAHGEMPLPPYIAGARPADGADREDYQTTFAHEPGAVAAPTAGLHFTPALLRALDARGVRRCTVTLHVGAGTFLPVKTEYVRDHRMHAEWGRIDGNAATLVNETHEKGGRVVAVGSTSLRLLESAADEFGRVSPFEGNTSIFITPGYRFRVADLMLTNFHLPQSSLLALVCAFAGTEFMLEAYRHAVEQKFRFYSYGDAMLIL